MYRKDIISELVNRGYDVKENDVVKNGVTLKGIMFNTATGVCPTVYVDRYETDTRDDDAIVDEIADTYMKGLEEQPEINTERLTDSDFILDHVLVGFQRVETLEDIVKRETELEGIEEYLYVLGGVDNGNQWSYKVSRQILKASGLTEREVWVQAYENTAKETVIKSMFEVMAEMMGENVADFIPDDGPQMFVITNKDKVKGASCFIDKESLRNLGKKVNTTKFFVLPSSIHEMIIIPYSENMDIKELNAMVSNVNHSQVNPVEQLGDHAYLVEI